MAFYMIGDYFDHEYFDAGIFFQSTYTNHKILLSIECFHRWLHHVIKLVAHLNLQELPISVLYTIISSMLQINEAISNVVLSPTIKHYGIEETKFGIVY